jgi:flagella basal body P-ring formation protein FlgA
MVCHPLFHDRILGSDLAAAEPSLALLPPEFELGYAPSPGIPRVFRVSQLQQLATKFQINANFAQPVCFAWRLHDLASQEILSAMHKTLEGEEPEIEIVDQSHFQVPDGNIHFPLQGLSGTSDKPATWNGFVEYGGSGKFGVWARVRISVHEKNVITVRAISAGEVVEASALKTIDYQGPPKRYPALRSEEEAAGQCARWAIAAGSLLTKSMLVPPKDIEKEQLVTVHVNSGAAHIETQGIADDGGYVGNVIPVHNPKTGRVFRARIDERGVVTVVPGGKVGLVLEDKKS